MTARLCLMTIHAHPDDEASKGAATISRYHSEGVRTVLVCCTGGEAGDILNPAMDRPGIRDNLHEVRMRELAVSAAAIGFDEIAMLGFRDSGMSGTDANRHPLNFLNADLDGAVARLVRVIRRERPQVMITYPEQEGNTQHPDHVRVHEVSGPAFELAGNPRYRLDLGDPWAPTKLYYSMRSQERIQARHEAFLVLGLESPYDRRRLGRPPLGRRATAQIAIAGHIAARSAALLAHATQIDPKSKLWFGLPDHVEQSIHPFDYYRLARGPEPVEVPERDLFAGLREGPSG